MPDKEVPWTRRSKGGEPSTLIACVMLCQIGLALIRFLPFPVRWGKKAWNPYLVREKDRSKSGAARPVYRPANFDTLAWVLEFSCPPLAVVSYHNPCSFDKNQRLSPLLTRP